MSKTTTRLRKFSDIEFQDIDFLWEGRIPLKTVTLLVGIGGRGKSTTTARIAADASTGQLEGRFKGEPTPVLIANAEDPSESVMGPRLEAARADRELIYELRMEEDKTDPRNLVLPGDIEALRDTIRDTLKATGAPTMLTIIDPFRAHLTMNVDAKQEHHMRYVLDNLAGVAANTNTAIVLVDHPNKQEESVALVQRVAGAGTFNSVRSALVFGSNPDDLDGDTRVIAHGKSNWGRFAPSMVATIKDKGVQLPNGTVRKFSYIEWGEESPHDYKAVLEADSPRRGHGNTLTKGKHLEIYLHGILDLRVYPGVLASEVKKRAKLETGCSDRTLKEAIKKLGRLMEKVEHPGGSGVWYYWMRSPDELEKALGF